MIEQVELASLEEIVAMSKTTAFADFKAMLQELVSEAHETMIGCVAADPNIRSNIMMRYQQRVCIMREVERWAESKETALNEIRQAMIDELNRANGGENGNASNYRQ